MSLLSKSGKLKNIIFLFSAGSIIAAAVYGYFHFFRTAAIKKELITSLAVTPNDSSETFLNHKDEIVLKIPRGEIKEVDTLSLYNVLNINKPDFADQLLKTYDFQFKNNRNFKNDVELQISYISELTNRKNVKNVTIVFFNEKQNLWEEVDTEIDKANYKLFFKTKHFSSYGIVSYDVLKGYPLMKIREMKRPSLLDKKPGLNKAQVILESYANNNLPSKDATNSGYDMMVEAFGLSSAFTSFSEEVIGLPVLETFNKYAGELGLLFSLKQFSSEIFEGKNEQAKLNLCKNLMLYSLGKWGSEALKISNIGIFFIDYSLTKFGTKGLEVREKKYQDIYDNFNTHHNIYRKDKEKWTAFIVDVISSNQELQTVIDDELNKYLTECFNEEGSMIPEDIREILVAKEKEKTINILHSALREAKIELENKRKNEILKKFYEAKDLLNSELQIMVSVYSDGNEKAGLPVKIVVPKGQNLWEGTTDDAGQWSLKCTWLGYLYYSKPLYVEVNYKGKILQEEIKLNKKGAIVRIYLPKETDQETGEFDIRGSYSGTYTSHPSAECTIKGEVYIEIDAVGNVRLTASGKGGCKCADWSSKEEQTFTLKADNPYYDKKNNVYRIHLKGTETKKITYINPYETTIKDYKWDDRNYSIVVYRDGSIKTQNPHGTYYFKVEANKN